MRKICLLAILGMLFSYSVHAQTILSVNDLLKIQASIRKNTNEWVDILTSRGYTKTYQQSPVSYYFYKGCKLIIPDDEGSRLRGIEIEASPKNSNASFINLIVDEYGGGYASITVYGKANAQKWVNQIKALGYRSNSNGGKGNQGQSWEYSKSGYPDLCLWNDYGTTYALSLNF